MSENMDRKVTETKEQKYAEQGSKEPNRAAQAAISQVAAYVAQGGQGNSSDSSSSGGNS